MSAELSSRIGDIARRLLGSPNADLSNSTQLRFGNNGSIAVEADGPKAGTWYDHEQKIGGNAWQLMTLKGGMLNGAAIEWLKSELGIEVEQPKAKAKRKISATYGYRDETGGLVFQVVRYDDPKDFRQRRPDGSGG